MTDTFLYNDEISSYSLDGYHFVDKQRSTRGGGVGVYLCDGAAESFEYSDVDIAGTESIMLELKGGAFWNVWVMPLPHRDLSAAFCRHWCLSLRS